MIHESRRFRVKGFLHGLRRADRAATLAFTAVSVAVLLGCTALAVDLGMLLSARVQSQRAADTGALAGASILAKTSGTEAGARSEAIEYSNLHNVLSYPVAVGNGDVDVIMAERKVRVRVHHTVNTLFATIFGVDEVNVSTVAAAIAAPAGGVTCPLPIAAPDNFDDLNGNGIYDPEEPYQRCDGTNGATCTGYQLNGQGTLIEVKTQPSNGGGGDGGKGGKSGDGGSGGGTAPDQTCESQTGPGWFCWIHPEGSNGNVNDLRSIIAGDCSQWDGFKLSIGAQALAAPGEKHALLPDLANYIDSHDPDHHWLEGGGDDGRGCVANGQGQCVESSDRIRSLPIVNPTIVTGGGQNVESPVVNVAGAFMEKVAAGPDLPHRGGAQGQWNFYVRLLSDASGAGGGIGEDQGQLLKKVVLVE